MEYKAVHVKGKKDPNQNQWAAYLQRKTLTKYWMEEKRSKQIWSF